MTIEFQLQTALREIESLRAEIAELEGLELLNAALLEHTWRAYEGDPASIRSAVADFIRSDEARGCLMDDPEYLEEDEQQNKALEWLDSLLSFRSGDR